MAAILAYLLGELQARRPCFIKKEGRRKEGRKEKERKEGRKEREEGKKEREEKHSLVFKTFYYFLDFYHRQTIK